MKKLICATALAVLVVSPVIAQTTEQRAPSTEAGRTNTRTVRQQEPRHDPANDVRSTTGRIIGSDPDPQVRTMLQLDQVEYGD